MSGKKSKKADKDASSGPTNKKLKRSSSAEGTASGAGKTEGRRQPQSQQLQSQQQQQQQQQSQQPAMSMTIPRKKDPAVPIPKKGSTTTSSTKSSSTMEPSSQSTKATQQQGKITNDNNKTEAAVVESDKDKEIDTAIPKKTKSSKASSDSSSNAAEKSSSTTPGANSSQTIDKSSKLAEANTSVTTEKAEKTTKTVDENAKTPEEPEESTSAKDAALPKSDPESIHPDNKLDAETKDKDSKQLNTEKTENESVAPESDQIVLSNASPAAAEVTTSTATRRTSIKSQQSSNKKGVSSSSTGTTTTLTAPKPLRIDTSMAQKSTASGHLSASTTPLSTKQPKTPTTSTAMDNHPYARGSVIEVIHGVSDEVAGDDWWFEDSDDEEEKDGNGSGTNNPDAQTTSENSDTKMDTEIANDPEPSSSSPQNGSSKKSSSVRLCDVIDRVSIGDKQWRYYVHYRDFNRRMDEWVAMERIVSPPSVGNAKARAIKKEEERQKRKLQRIEERHAELTAAAAMSAPRSSRRRGSVQPPGTTTAADGGGTTPSAAAAAAAATAATTPDGGVDSETPRRTRLQRKKSTVEDDATVVAGNSSGGGAGSETTSAPLPPSVIVAEVGIVSVHTTAATTHTVGEHVVATIPAQELDEHEGLDEASLREHEEVTKVKNVAFVELGPYQMETWYFSPLPKELLSEKGYIEVLYVCEFTFSLFSRKSELQRFQARLPTHSRHPPGNEIYRSGNLAMFEVDGFQERIYCQNLCYIAKLFLDHKTLYFDVDPFLFYVMCEVDNRGFHPVGYYSKEKYSDVGYNLACILTFPSHQRKGYGRFLIAFSYELSKKEEKVGSPEKPMSDLGQQAYKPYWASTIVDFLLNQSPDSSSMSIMDISKLTSIMAEDIVFTLNQLGILKIINGVYFVAAEQGLLKILAKKYPVKDPKVDPTRLHWTPFLTDIKRDKFSVHSKKPSVDGEEMRGSGGFP